jgi:hypothetical protein
MTQDDLQKEGETSNPQLKGGRSSTRKSRSSQPRANLSTPVGRLLDRTSYDSLSIVIVLVVLSCSIYYWIATPHRNGGQATELSFWNSVYFSITTFTSLGFGDIYPVGYGRAGSSAVLFYA